MDLFIPHKSTDVKDEQGQQIGLPTNWRTIEIWANSLSFPLSGPAWGFDGPLIVSTGIPQQGIDGTIGTLRGTITSAGGTATVVSFYINGNVVDTLTIPAFTATAKKTVRLTTADGDVLVPVITTPGANSITLSFQIEYV